MKTGIWYVRGAAPVQFGDTGPPGGPTPESNLAYYIGDVPVPADYDGDGRDDIATYNPWTNTWRFYGRPDSIELGEPGDYAVPADYDGDGKAEPAVYDLITGKWSVHAQATTFVGGVEAYPVPADYDGDGTDDRSYVALPDGWEGDLVWVVPGSDDLIVGTGWHRPIPMADAFLLNIVRLTFMKRCWLDSNCYWM